MSRGDNIRIVLLLLLFVSVTAVVDNGADAALSFLRLPTTVGSGGDGEHPLLCRLALYVSRYYAYIVFFV